MATIVISYRRDDSKHIAGRIYDRLENHYGKGHVFMDIDSIPFGLDFRDHIRDTLERCDVLVAIVGPNWIGKGHTAEHILDETDWVRIEIEAALNKKIPVIPVLIDRSRMPKPSELPDGLKNFAFRQAADVDTQHFHSHMDKVIASIDQHLSKVQAPSPAHFSTLQVAQPKVHQVPQRPIEKTSDLPQRSADAIPALSQPKRVDIPATSTAEKKAVFIAIFVIVAIFILTAVVALLSR